MAHEIEGTSLLYAGDIPWHRIGTQVTPEQSSDVEYLRAHPVLNWTADLEPLYTRDGIPATHRAVVRSSDRKIIGEVGTDYTVVQPGQALDWFAPWLTSGQATAECIGLLRGGSRMFLLAKLAIDSAEVVKGDEVSPYVLMAQAFDGTMRLNVGFTPTRVVCANTLAMAKSNTRSKLIQLRHTSGIHLALDTIRQTMDLANREFKATIAQYAQLAACRCTDETLAKYVKLVFSQTDEAVEEPYVHPWATPKEEKTRLFPKILDLFQSGRGSDIPGVRGTMWGALNAVSEHVQYNRGSDEARRLDETWFGSGNKIVKKAHEVAMAMAA